jgi:hypothetical protein
MSTWEISAASQQERWQIHLPLQCSQRFGKLVDHMILFLNEVVHQTNYSVSKAKLLFPRFRWVQIH